MKPLGWAALGFGAAVLGMAALAAMAPRNAPEQPAAAHEAPASLQNVEAKPATIDPQKARAFAEADESSSALGNCFDSNLVRFTQYRRSREALYAVSEAVCLERLHYNRYFCPDQAKVMLHQMVDDLMFQQGYARPVVTGPAPSCDNYVAKTPEQEEQDREKPRQLEPAPVSPASKQADNTTG